MRAQMPSSQVSTGLSAPVHVSSAQYADHGRSSLALPTEQPEHGQARLVTFRNRYAARSTPVRAPRANAIAERLVGTVRRELLDRLVIINQRHAAAVLREFERHYNNHRPHRSLGQAAPSRPLPHRAPTEISKIQRHDRLGGLLHEYQQVA